MSSRQYTLDTSGPRWRFQETEASKLRNEREQEAREYRRQFRSPRARRILLAIAVLLALLPALVIWSLWHVPTEEQARVATVAQAPATFVNDPADLLTPAQEQDLLRGAEARRDKDLLTREHAALALRLDEIDERARSVDSHFVDGELRAQWQQVSDRFLEFDHAVRDLPVALDSDALANATALHDAAQALEDAQHARDAAAKAGDEVLADGLDRISNRFHALAAKPENASFMDTFVRVLGDYRTSMEVLQARHFAARQGVDDYEAPRLWEPDFRYPGYFSYHELSLWDATSNSPSSGSGTNSGFSSGFSGSGGSSSF